MKISFRRKDSKTQLNDNYSPSVKLRSKLCFIFNLFGRCKVESEEPELLAESSLVLNDDPEFVERNNRIRSWINESSRPENQYHLAQQDLPEPVLQLPENLKQDHVQELPINLNSDVSSRSETTVVNISVSNRSDGKPIRAKDLIGGTRPPHSCEKLGVWGVSGDPLKIPLSMSKRTLPQSQNARERHGLQELQQRISGQVSEEFKKIRANVQAMLAWSGDENR
jgi:hypothetical protein